MTEQTVTLTERQFHDLCRELTELRLKSGRITPIMATEIPPTPIKVAVCPSCDQVADFRLVKVTNDGTEWQCSFCNARRPGCGFVRYVEERWIIQHWRQQMSANNEYTFTGNQLCELLIQTIRLYQEYRDVHGYGQEAAIAIATVDTLEGLDAERELVQAGEVTQPGQVIER